MFHTAQIIICRCE